MTVVYSPVGLTLHKANLRNSGGASLPLFFYQKLTLHTLSKKRKYTIVQISEVISLYNEGLNFTQISKQLNCSRNTVRNRIKEYINNTGKSIPTRTKPGLNAGQIKKVLDLKNSDVSVKDISSMFDVTDSCIYKILKKYGS